MSNETEKSEICGPVLALDLGEKRIGLALSDRLLISIRRLEVLTRSNWKQLLKDVTALARLYDAKTLVIGLPLRMDGKSGSAAAAALDIARKFSRSVDIPVYLQDERLTSIDARDRLREEGFTGEETARNLDSESAVIILRDFLTSENKVQVAIRGNDE